MPYREREDRLAAMKRWRLRQIQERAEEYHRAERDRMATFRAAHPALAYLQHLKDHRNSERGAA